MASFFGMANTIDDIKSNPRDHIKAKLESGANADDILKELLNNITNDEFKELLCDGDKCIQFYPGPGDVPFKDDRSKMTELYRLDHKITAICKEECNLDEVRKFYNTLSAKKKYYEAQGDSLDRLIAELNGMTLGGGKRKKQTGGGIAEIAQLLAGLDVVVLAMLNNSGMDVEIINRTIYGIITLLSKAALAISALPPLLSCMREIMGDTLYRIVERFTTSMVAYKAAAFTWEHKMALISILGKMLSYAPDAAGLAISLIVGFVVTKVATSAASAAASVDYKGQAIAALDALDAATPGDLANVGTKVVTKTVDLTKTFISLSVDLVIKIRKQLADAHDENARKILIAKANEKADMDSDWAALLAETKLKDLPGQTALNDDEKRKLNIMFENQFAAIRDAIRTSPEYIAAADMEAGPGAGAEMKDGPGAGAEMKDGPGAGAEMKDGPGAGAEMKDGPGAGAEMKDGPGAMDLGESVMDLGESVMDPGAGAMSPGASASATLRPEKRKAISLPTDSNADEKDDRSADQGLAKRGRGRTGFNENIFGFIPGGKRKSQKQKQQKQQKKTQKQSQKKLSKSKRAKKAKQSKKANKKH